MVAGSGNATLNAYNIVFQFTYPPHTYSTLRGVETSYLTRILHVFHNDEQSTIANSILPAKDGKRNYFQAFFTSIAYFYVSPRPSLNIATHFVHDFGTIICVFITEHFNLGTRIYDFEYNLRYLLKYVHTY